MLLFCSINPRTYQSGSQHMIGNFITAGSMTGVENSCWLKHEHWFLIAPNQIPFLMGLHRSISIYLPWSAESATGTSWLVNFLLKSNECIDWLREDSCTPSAPGFYLKHPTEGLPYPYGIVHNVSYHSMWMNQSTNLPRPGKVEKWLTKSQESLSSFVLRCHSLFRLFLSLIIYCPLMIKFSLLNQSRIHHQPRRQCGYILARPLYFMYPTTQTS